MANERTPLIQTVPVAAPRDRYPHTKIRRICTIALIVIPIITLSVILIVNSTQTPGDIPERSPKSPGNYTIPSAWPRSDGLDYVELKSMLHKTPDENKAREWSQYYTTGAHLAGKNLSQAEWTRDKWLEFGVHHAELAEYDVYLNYPLEHQLQLLDHGKVTYRAALTEDVLEEDPTTGDENSIPTFHGYSANGNVTAPYVFCNYGTLSDYTDLQNANVSLAGKIALVKYGGNIFRSLKIKRAEDLGMIGVVMYTDPGDDGDITEEHGNKAYPDGPARHPSSVQRGSVMYLWNGVGDPTTIGYPSKPGVPRQTLDNKIPAIPSLPISFRDALPLLKALNNHGPTAASFPKSWHSGGLGYQGVNYNIGPSPDSLQLNLFNKQEYVTTPIWNAIGVINGTLEDEVVVIGNHRDAWILGGAGDPNSGSAILNECVRAFGKALAAGWKPQRTIVFASWDGEEYGLLGSTEWVEEYLPWLSSSAVAYINLDTAASGPELVVASTPNFEDAIGKVLREVQSPDQSTPGQTVHDVWNGEVDLLGSGSDFTAFLDFAGVSSIHIGFEAGEGSPVYQYHSNYDSFHWMEKFGDPGFKYHVALAQVTNLLAAKFIEEPIISFEAHTYSNAISGYLGSINKTIDKLPHKISTEFSDAIEKIIPSFLDFRNATDHHDTQAQKLSERLNANPHPELIPDLFRHARVLNQRYKQLERQFLDDGGLEGRNWFKHTIYAPGLWTGYAAVALPGLSEALDNRNLTAFKRAAEVLVGQFEAAKHLLWPEQYP